MFINGKSISQILREMPDGRGSRSQRVFAPEKGAGDGGGGSGDGAGGDGEGDGSGDEDGSGEGDAAGEGGDGEGEGEGGKKAPPKVTLKQLRAAEKAAATAVKDLEKATKDAKALKDKYGDLDPEAARAAIKSQRDAEKDAAEKRGEFDRVKQLMVDEHGKELKAKDDKLAEVTQTVSTLNQTINELTIGNAFANSSFIREDLITTADKTRKIFGEHFEVENGKVVAYDKPRGSDTRTPLVNGSGKALSFDEAMKKLVEADTDRDHMLRSKMGDGAGSGTKNKPLTGKDVPDGITGVSRMALALRNRKKAA